MVSRSLRTCSAVLRHKINITERLNRGRQWEINHRIPLGKLRIIPSRKVRKIGDFINTGKTLETPEFSVEFGTVPREFLDLTGPFLYDCVHLLKPWPKKRLRAPGFERLVFPVSSTLSVLASV